MSEIWVAIQWLGKDCVALNKTCSRLAFRVPHHFQIERDVSQEATETQQTNHLSDISSLDVFAGFGTEISTMTHKESNWCMPPDKSSKRPHLRHCSAHTLLTKATWTKFIYLLVGFRLADWQRSWQSENSFTIVQKKCWHWSIILFKRSGQEI